MDEKTTLIASLALVISLKSEKIKAMVLFFTEPTAVFILLCIGCKDNPQVIFLQPYGFISTVFETHLGLS